MTRPPPIVVIRNSAPVAPPRERSPMDAHDFTPRQKPNPLALAQFWLRSRLEERPAGYFLDGTPANLDRIMQETNRLLLAHGAAPVATNPRWLP